MPPKMLLTQVRHLMQVLIFVIFLTDNCQKLKKLFSCLSLIVQVLRNKKLFSSLHIENAEQRERYMGWRGIDRQRIEYIW